MQSLSKMLQPGRVMGICPLRDRRSMANTEAHLSADTRVTAADSRLQNYPEHLEIVERSQKSHLAGLITACVS